MILTSTPSQLSSDVDDTRTRSLSPSSASDLKQRAVLQQGLSSSITAAALRSSINSHPGILDYQSRLSTQTTRTSSDVHDAPVPVPPFPASTASVSRKCAMSRVSRPLEDGPPPPRLRTQPSRTRKEFLSRKIPLKDSANAESNPTTRYTSSVLQYPKPPPKSSVQPTYYRSHEHNLTAPLLSDTNDSGGRVGRSSKLAPPLGKTESPITPSAALIPTQYQSDFIRACPTNSRNLTISISNPCSQPPGLPGDSQTLAISSDKSLIVSRSLSIDY